MIAAIDLEGVLAPEIWPHLGDHFGVDELHLTTRDVGDFEELMGRRVAALNRAGLTLARLQEVAREVRPYLGAHEFLDRIRGQKARVVQGMKSAGFKVIGMGDSLNDLTLLESADYPILFRPVAALRERLPEAPIADGLDEALELFVRIF